MLEIIGKRQKELLQLLIRNKGGLTVDELAQRLRITRNAVRQHLATLSTDGLVTPSATRPSGGRPQQLYALTDKGKEMFPRHYSWFARLAVEAITREHGAAGLRKRLAEMGTAVGEQLRARHPGAETRPQKVGKLAGIMDELGYNARMVGASDKAPVIEADNCVFHELAMKNPEICQFDLAMMGAATGSKVDHQECMARGGNVCRFKFTGGK
ncbi:MAG TPA: HTH domain-containing protein [Burkholderiales bacterium]|nr:HTH domain-containing protein [Burkholderiales bacterium]